MRLFIQSKDLDNNSLKLTQDLSHHIQTVLRKKKGDLIDIVINQSTCQTVQITHLSNTQLTFKLIEEKPTPQEPIHITLAQGLPKQDKFSEVLRACTELGVRQFIPLITQYTDKNAIQKAPSKKTRWQKIIHSAAMQSQRITIPDLYDPTPISELEGIANNHNLTVICWENETEKTLKSCLNHYPDIQSILIIIGPEGGLSLSEISKLQKEHTHTIKLGHNILRTEHAGSTTVAQILYHYL